MSGPDTEWGTPAEVAQALKELSELDEGAEEYRKLVPKLVRKFGMGFFGVKIEGGRKVCWRPEKDES